MFAEFWQTDTEVRHIYQSPEAPTLEIQDAGEALATEGQRHPLGKNWVSWGSARPSLIGGAALTQPPTDGS